MANHVRVENMVYSVCNFVGNVVEQNAWIARRIRIVSLSNFKEKGIMCSNAVKYLLIKKQSLTLLFISHMAFNEVKEEEIENYDKDRAYLNVSLILK